MKVLQAVSYVAVLLEVLADVDSLLDELVEVLREVRGKSSGLEDSEDLSAGQGLDLGDTAGVTEDDTCIRVNACYGNSNTNPCNNETRGHLCSNKKIHTDAGWGETLLGELDDVLDNILRGVKVLQPLAKHGKDILFQSCCVEQ